MLMAILAPKDDSKETMSKILDSNNANDGLIKIGNDDYYFTTMDGTWCDDFDIFAEDGSLVFITDLTTGYGINISLKDLNLKATILDTWANKMSKRYNCSYNIEVTATTW